MLGAGEPPKGATIEIGQRRSGRNVASALIKKDANNFYNMYTVEGNPDVYFEKVDHPPITDAASMFEYGDVGFVTFSARIWPTISTHWYLEYDKISGRRSRL